MKTPAEFVIVGILMRVEQSTRDEVVQELDYIPGVTSFMVGDDFKLGALIESATLDEAKELLENRIETTPGVLAVWPIFIHEEEGLPLVEIASVEANSFQRSEVT